MRQTQLLPFFLAFTLAACGGRAMPGDMGHDGTDGSVTDGGGTPDLGRDAGTPDLGPSDLGADLGEACGTGFCGAGTYCCNTCCLPNSMPLCLPSSCAGVDGGPHDGGGGTDGGPGVDGGAHDGGTTGMSCGGFPGTVCASGYFCSYTLAAICGAADATGTCAPIPDLCSAIFSPVCGCDGRDYGNECEANSAGTSVSHAGMCSPPPPPPPPGDCRATGCPHGETCEPCWTTYACLPPGAVC